MKKTILTSSLLIGLSLFGGSPAPQPLSFTWQWNPNPADLGGLSTNDYLTNISFTLWTTTNVTLPVTSWSSATNWQASSTPNDGTGNWTGVATIDGQTRFYLLTVNALGGGQSPFSNQANWVAKPLAGLLKSVK